MVFLTGGAFTTPGREFLAKISNACIEKPFDPGTLSTVVRALLSGVRSSGGHRAVAVE